MNVIAHPTKTKYVQFSPEESLKRVLSGSAITGDLNRVVGAVVCKVLELGDMRGGLIQQLKLRGWHYAANAIEGRMA